MAPKNNDQFIFKLYKPLLIAMLVFGYNYGFANRWFTKIAYVVYSTIIIIIISYANMTCCPAQELSFIWSLIEYTLFVIYLWFYNSKIRVYCKKVLILDTYLRINRRHYYRIRKKIFIILGIMWVGLAGYTICYCTMNTCYTEIISFLVYQVFLLALGINRVWRYILFEEIWRRLRLLRTRFEESPNTYYYLYVKNNKTVKENKVRLCMYLYRSIADLLDLISPEVSASVFISIVCCLPRLIFNFYRILLVIDNVLPMNSLGFILMHIFQTGVYVFSPCIVVELYGLEVEKLRQALLHRLYEETDKESREDIHLFLMYTRIRPFKYKVWRVIPMNLTLPLQILNLCTTYVIVIVNFTKVFDS